METELLSLTGVGRGEQAAWRDLAAHAVEPNPFFEPEFVLPSFRHLRSRGMRLLVVRDGEEWISCLPVLGATASAGALVGWSHPHSYLATPLIRADAIERGVRGLLNWRRRRPNMLCLREMGAGGPVERALRKEGDRVGLVSAWERRFLRAAARPLDGNTRPRRRSLRRMRRRLQEELGAPLETVDLAGDPKAIERFLALEAAGWKGRRGTALACRPGDRAFFVAMTEAFAAQGRLWLSVLRAGDRVLAMSSELRTRDALFGFKSCHDESLRRYAPGVQLFDEVIERFHADEDLPLYDSCSAPDNKLMNELFGDRRECASFVAVPRLVADPAQHAVSGALAARRQARRTLVRARERRSIGAPG